METFLEKLVKEIQSGVPAGPGEICVVFPSRRATTFFHDACARDLQSPSVIPDSLSFEDFIASVTQLVFPDALTLAFELYPDYAAHFPDEPFDKYYSWAHALFEAIEETTQSLADVHKVFASIHELKKLDATIDSWDQGEEETAFRHRFLSLWEAIPSLYDQLCARLQAKGLATISMALVSAIRQAEAGTLKLNWNRIWFAGFGTLTPAEEAFIQLLVKAGVAECRWDLDTWYMNQQVQESGSFFRSFQSRHKGITMNWIESRLATEEKNITVTGVAGRSAQAKAAGIKLAEAGQETLGKETAVILPDEGLLFPLLNSLPPSVREVNVTMGFPLRSTPLFALTDSILQAHEGASAQTGTAWQFYHKEVTTILRHPYMKALWPEAATAVLDRMESENLVYLSGAEITEAVNEIADSQSFLLLFAQPESPADLMTLFLGLMNGLKTWFEEKLEESGRRMDPELELLFHFRALLLRIEERLAGHPAGIDLKTFRRVFRELIRQASIPFTGEPLSGLQIMGMLESRVLDFENLIILSANEGILPAHSRQPGFIPYSVRKAFGLPTFEDRDSLFSWHFYRLLQRAKNITLIYNTEPDVLGSGEPSRYISQLKAELVGANPHIHWKEEILSFRALTPPTPPIHIVKTPEVIEKIKNLGETRGFSPSALNSYLACSLQFYFRYVKGLKEKDEVEESAGGDTFGKVFHAVMDKLYQPFLGKEITLSDLDDISAQIPALSASLFKEIGHTRNTDFGKNHLLLGVIRELAEKTIELDRALVPFSLVALEQELELPIITTAGEVKLRGILDRVHLKNGITHIIDYKTGVTGSLKMEEPSKAGEPPQRKEAFQLATYAMLFQGQPGNPERVQSGVLSLRNLSKGVQWLEMGLTKETLLDHANVRDFTDRVHEVIHEMLSEELLFSQTTDLDVCKFCAYKGICNRQ